MLHPPSNNVTDEEIKEALFAIPKTGVGGPDVFNLTFFISCWGIIKKKILLGRYIVPSEVPGC